MTCAKQTTVAVLIGKSGKNYVGTNECHEPQSSCPRGDMPSGEGYHLCTEVCKQTGHAEVNACREAMHDAEGGTLILHGHTYCCDDCINTMQNTYGVQRYIIAATGQVVELSPPYKEKGFPVRCVQCDTPYRRLYKTTIGNESCPACGTIVYRRGD